MPGVPAGGLLVSMPDAADRRLSERSPDELDAEGQSVPREAAGHGQRGAAGEVERLGVDVVDDETAPGFVRLDRRVGISFARGVGHGGAYEAIDIGQEGMDLRGDSRADLRSGSDLLRRNQQSLLEMDTKPGAVLIGATRECPR